VEDYGQLASDSPVLLELSDAAFAERLQAFLTSLDLRTTVRGPSVLELERELEDLELAIYLRVWDVLYPEASIVVAHTAFEPPAAAADSAA
jgi:hypothetical protein